MKFRLIEYQTFIFIVVGIGYNRNYIPPEVFYCVPLEDTIYKSVLTNIDVIEIPLSQVTEITDKKRIQAIWVLYGA